MKIKVYSKSELAKLYGVTRVTFNKWVKPVFKNYDFGRSGRCNYYTPKEVKMIFEHLGEPE